MQNILSGKYIWKYRHYNDDHFAQAFNVLIQCVLVLIFADRFWDYIRSKNINGSYYDICQKYLQDSADLRLLILKNTLRRYYMDAVQKYMTTNA